MWLLAVCTNKYEHLACKLLRELGEIKRFPTITGGDTFPFKKPDPNHILKTIELAGGVPERAVMVGDSNNDIAAAKAADISSIAVTFGYTDIPVRELEPVAIIDNFDELVTVANALMPD